MVYASVVICTMGHPFKVIECLRKQTFQDFEIILAQEKGIVPAMNKALARAKGEIFIRIDDDVEMPETWLEQLIRPFCDPLIAGCTGPTFVPKERRQNRDSIRWAENPKGLLKWLYDRGDFKPGGIYKCGNVSYDSNYKERFWIETLEDKDRNVYLNNEFQSKFFEPDHLEGTNWAMRTQLIRDVGGFDPKFGGVAEWFDTDVEQKIKKKGFILYYNPKAYLYHLLEKGHNYNERFSGFGRIKNWLRYHFRHSKFHPKMIVFLLVWIGYFISLNFRKK